MLRRHQIATLGIIVRFQLFNLSDKVYGWWRFESLLSGTSAYSVYVQQN